MPCDRPTPLRTWNFMHGCRNPGRQIARLTKFYAVVLNICGSSVRNLLSPFWFLEFGSGLYIFGKYVDPCLNVFLKNVTASRNSPETFVYKKTQNHNERFYAQLYFTDTMTRCWKLQSHDSGCLGCYDVFYHWVNNYRRFEWLWSCRLHSKAHDATKYLVLRKIRF